MPDVTPQTENLGGEQSSPSAEVSMGFEEAMTRAEAAHVQGRVFYQPGNNYEPETECSCGLFVYTKRFPAHVLAAADAFREGFRLDGSGVLFTKRVPL